jgi:hypothetical protein
MTILKSEGCALIYTTTEVRRSLKILAAVSGQPMKKVLARLVADELKRLKVKP